MNGQQTSYSSNYYSASTSPCFDLDALSLELPLHGGIVKYNLYNLPQIFYRLDCNHSTIFLHIAQPSNDYNERKLVHPVLLKQVLVDQLHSPLQKNSA